LARELIDDDQVQVYVGSPVYPLLTDQYGRRVGFLSNGTQVNEIPGASISDEFTDAYRFEAPASLNYTVSTRGHGSGSMNLSFFLPVNRTTIKEVVYKDVPVSPGSRTTTSLGKENTDWTMTLDGGQSKQPDHHQDVRMPHLVYLPLVLRSTTGGNSVEKVSVHRNLPEQEAVVGQADELDKSGMEVQVQSNAETSVSDPTGDYAGLSWLKPHPKMRDITVSGNNVSVIVPNWLLEGDGADVTIDAAYTTDYWYDSQYTYRPGEAIRLALEATNHTPGTLAVTYDWDVYDPNGARVDSMSWEDFASSMTPGENERWHLSRGVPSDTPRGIHRYVASVTHSGGTDSQEATFNVSGSPMAINLLEAVTCRDVQNSLAVGRTDTFDTNDERVYIWAAWEGASGTHTSRVVWYRPDSTVHYDSSYEFTSAYPLYYTWSWLNTPYMNQYGQWRVVLYMDGTHRATRYFTFQGASSTQPSELEPPEDPGGMDAGSPSVPFVIMPRAEDKSRLSSDRRPQPRRDWSHN
jgi:hypothetical protein